MSVAYIYNVGRQIHIQMENIHVQYIGSKSLSRFIEVNDYSDGCISVEAEFNIDDQLVQEEDYIDLRDVLSDYNYNSEKIIKSITKIEIGKPQSEKISKKELIEKALMVSDNMALVYSNNITNDVRILAVSMKDTNARAIISILNFDIISSNMSEAMLIRAKNAVKRNHEQLIDEIKERHLYA